MPAFGQCMPGFFKLFLCGCLYVRMLVCVSTPEASGLIYTQYDWLNNDYSFYMAAVVIAGGWRALRFIAHRRN